MQKLTTNLPRGSRMGVLPSWAMNAALEHYRQERPEMALVIFRRPDGSPILYVSGQASDVEANLVWAKGFLEDALDFLPDDLDDEDDELDSD